MKLHGGLCSSTSNNRRLFLRSSLLFKNSKLQPYNLSFFLSVRDLIYFVLTKPFFASNSVVHLNFTPSALLNLDVFTLP